MAVFATSNFKIFRGSMPPDPPPPPPHTHTQRARPSGKEVAYGHLTSARKFIRSARKFKLALEKPWELTTVNSAGKKLRFICSFLHTCSCLLSQSAPFLCFFLIFDQCSDKPAFPHLKPAFDHVMVLWQRVIETLRWVLLICCGIKFSIHDMRWVVQARNVTMSWIKNDWADITNVLWYSNIIPPVSMGPVRITSWYPKFNGSHFDLPPSPIYRTTGLGGKMVWMVMYSHRPDLYHHCTDDALGL